ncbi:MAG: choline/carnitine/betaine transporter [Desulfitibacter sp. BRH_c19]|nr:MAG: choline/carnitine/betaine transporter [Desulfitibacter sp. BRH_c19]
MLYKPGSSNYKRGWEKTVDKSKLSQYAKINPIVFYGGVIFCVIFYGPMLVLREQLQPLGAQVLRAVTYSFDWLWLLLAFGCFIFLVWLAFGRYGNVKLGGPDDSPEFSRFSWLSMLFTGGVGAGLVYWSMAEPIFYLKWPPFWGEAFSAQAAQFAIAYGVFHWGVLAWGLFTPGAIAFAYMIYVRKKPYFYPSYACRGVLGNVVDGWVGTAINLFVIVGLVGGLGTTMGVVIPMISEVIAHMIGVENTLMVKSGTAVLLSVIFGYSAYSGLRGGIKKLSELNSWLCFGLLGFVLIAGPTLWMLSFYVDSIGVLLDNFLRMSLYTDPITKSGFPQDWTVFYWAWWVAWAIYFGLFIARISKGRTIKDVILNMAFTTTLGCSIFFLVFGGYAVDLQLNQGLELDAVLAASGGGAMIVAVLESLPFSGIVIPFFVLVMLIFQATTIDSNAYTIAMISCNEIKYNQEPPRWARLFWCFLLCVIGIAIMSVGGLQIVQLSSVATSVPIVFIIVILMLSVMKWLKEDFGDAVGPKILTIDYTESKNAPKTVIDDKITKNI